VAGFRYLLWATDGTEPGEVSFAFPNWKPGDEFRTGDGRRFRILRIMPFLEDGPFKAE